MLIDIEEAIEKYDMKVDGILHIGAHYGEEAPVYDRIGVPVWWVEGNPKAFRKLRSVLKRFPNQDCVAAVVSDSVGEVNFNVANNGQSSSILELGTHKQEHPEVKYVDAFNATTTTIDDLWTEQKVGLGNFVNLDIQGAELLALRGGRWYLENVDYIYSEVNRKELYVGCAIISDLDNYLREFGFKRVQVEWTQHGWGDALWIRQDSAS